MMRYDFVGYTNYKHSMVSSDTQASARTFTLFSR